MRLRRFCPPCFELSAPYGLDPAPGGGVLLLGHIKMSFQRIALHYRQIPRKDESTASSVIYAVKVCRDRSSIYVHKKKKKKKIQLSHGVALTNRFLHYNECGHCSLFWASPTHRLLLQQMCINVWLNVVQWIHKYANKFNSVYSCWSYFCYNTISVMHSIPNTQSWLTTFSWTSVFCGLQLNTFGNQMF